MRFAVAVFAKTIGLSPVKTRLAASIGTELAEEFYQLSVACIHDLLTAVVMKKDYNVFPQWALAEKEGPAQFVHRTFPSLWTGEGDLGSRLATVSEMLFKDHDGVVMIGTDSPQVDSQRLLSALTWMKNDPDGCVVGPAKDGGFYLFGSRQPVSRKIWESVTYSNDTTLAELVSHLQDCSIHYLPEEQDVDIVEDLVRLEENLTTREAQVSKSQRLLLDWLQSNRQLF